MFVGSGLLEGLGKEMNFEKEIENGGVMESSRIKKSQYQVIPAEVLESHRKDRLWGYLERSTMKNPVYYRLMKDGGFAGFKRIVTEWLTPGSTRWQLDSISHDDEATQKLSVPAMGTASLPREKIIKGDRKRGTGSKDEDVEPQEPKIDRGKYL